VTLSTFPTFLAFPTQKLFSGICRWPARPHLAARAAPVSVRNGTLPWAVLIYLEAEGLGRLAIAGPGDHPGERHRRLRRQDVSR